MTHDGLTVGMRWMPGQAQHSGGQALKGGQDGGARFYSALVGPQPIKVVSGIAVTALRTSDVG